MAHSKGYKLAMANANKLRDTLTKMGVWCNEPFEAKDGNDITMVCLETGLVDCNLNDVVFRFAINCKDVMLITDYYPVEDDI